SVPLELLPFYRERVFPVAEAAGFVPVTGAEVINLGESLSAKIDTLIDRASLMVVDLSSVYTRAEFAMAVSIINENPKQSTNRQRLQVIAIVTRREALPFGLPDVLPMMRPEPLSEDS